MTTAWCKIAFLIMTFMPQKTGAMEIFTLKGRNCYLLGSETAKWVLIQPVDDNDLTFLEKEAELIGQMTDRPFALCAFQVKDWNQELSPWPAPAVFGDEGFGDGAEKILRFVLDELIPVLKDHMKDEPSPRFILGGYSLAGFFSLWAACQTNQFDAVAGVSPSVWFPGWMDYIQEHPIQCPCVYLSLGNKEEKTRNPVMRKVGDNIRTMADLLGLSQGACSEPVRKSTPEAALADTESEPIPGSAPVSKMTTFRTVPKLGILEWNQGNHFKEPDLRVAKGFSWILARTI